MESSPTELVCLTSAFDEGVSAGQSVTMTVVINDLTVANDLSVSMMGDVKSGISLTPASASPVLKTKIAIGLQSDFPYTLAKEDFTVNATSSTNSTYIKYMNVVEVDDATKTITTMFGGAHSGAYYISIRHREFGLVGTNPGGSRLTLDVSASVTSVTPKTASIYGGTLLTITGTNFGKEITDNPVQISYLGAVGSLDCFLLSTSATEIKCRLDDRKTIEDGKTGTVVVFLKTSEEATCESGLCHNFAHTNVLPAVTAAEAVFDDATSAWQVKVTGTGFTGDANSLELYVGQALQTTSSVSETEALFTVTDATDLSLAGMKLYFDIGIPEGHSTIDAGLTLTPKLVSLSPSSGSVGGTLVTATVPGVGAGT